MVDLKDKRVCLQADWPFLRLLNLKTSDEINCPICLASGPEIFLPRVLRCQHVFCLTCLARFFVECRQTCPVCQKTICLGEAKRARIQQASLCSGDLAEFFLVKKNVKSGKLELADPSSNSSINLGQKIKSLSIDKFEEMVFSDLDLLLNNQTILETEGKLLDFYQFLILKEIEENQRFVAPKFLGKRAAANSNKSNKEQLVYFYQEKQGMNIFMHPVDFEFLFEHFKNFDELPKRITCKIDSFEKHNLNNSLRKVCPEFAHIWQVADIEFIRCDLRNFLTNFDAQKHSKAFQNFEEELAQRKRERMQKIKKYSQSKDFIFSDEDDFYFCENEEYANRAFKLDSLQEVIMTKIEKQSNLAKRPANNCRKRKSAQTEEKIECPEFKFTNKSNENETKIFEGKTKNDAFLLSKESEGKESDQIGKENYNANEILEFSNRKKNGTLNSDKVDGNLELKIEGNSQIKEIFSCGEKQIQKEMEIKEQEQKTSQQLDMLVISKRKWKQKRKYKLNG